MPGRILYLNGLTSSGKSTAAKCLAKLCRTPLFCSSNDIFHNMIAGKFYAGHFWREIARTIGAQYAAVRGMGKAGFDVIVDGMGLDLPEYVTLFGSRHLDLVRKTFAGLDVTFIRFDCPADELRWRNLLRGDRGEFQSDEQARLNDPAFPADLVIDAMTTFPDEAARRILAFAGFPVDENAFAPEADEFRASILDGFLGDLADVRPACPKNAGFVKYVPDGPLPVAVDAVLRSPDAADAAADALLCRGYREVPTKGVRLFALGDRDFCRVLTAPSDDLTSMLGRTVRVTIDRPAGSRHPELHDLLYPIPYGFLAGTIAPDGEPIVAYCPGFA
ncbi:MAG: hypothetical protein J6V24_02830, partial [Clostridia bacterium]|nr:hypothetical protein [Clostridia bacterium]